MGFLTRRVVVGCILASALLFVQSAPFACAQPCQADAAPLQDEATSEKSDKTTSSVIVSTELLGRPYFRVVSVCVGSDISTVRRSLPGSLLTSTNTDFMESADEELYVLHLAWDVSGVNLDEVGATTLLPLMQFSDDVVWGAEPPHCEVQVVVCEPNAPTLAYHYFDGRGLNFPWAGIDADTFAGMEVNIRVGGGSWMDIDGDGGFFGLANPNGLWVDPSSLEEEVLYTLRLTTANGKTDFADIVVEEGVYNVTEYEGDRDGGDLSGNGPASGNQPGGGEPTEGSGNDSSGGSQSGDAGENASGGDELRESYGPHEVTISGKRANDLARRQSSVIFDFGDVTVSVPSQNILDLQLKNDSQLSASVERADDGSVSAQVNTDEGAPGVPVTISPVGQQSTSPFASETLAIVVALVAVAALAGGVFIVVRRWGGKGAHA